MPSNQNFYDVQTEQSQIKARIVNNYFTAWSRVMMRHWPGDIAYVDLFCGPGRYKDGNDSVPLKLIGQALEVPALNERMIFAFNGCPKKQYRKP